MTNNEIENLPKCKKSEANVNIQLAQLVRVANQLGLWKAADAVEKMFENFPSPEFGCFIDAYKDDGKWHEIYKTCVMDDGDYSSCIYASENGRKGPIKMKETYDVQNILTRLSQEIYLNIEKPNVRIKKQYHKVVTKLNDTIHESDILNDLKERL